MDRDHPNDGGKFYVDGNEVDHFDPTLRTGSLTNSGLLRLGSRSISLPIGPGLYRGILDEVELFPRALTPAEIQGIFRRRVKRQVQAILPGVRDGPVPAGMFQMGCDAANNGGYLCNPVDLPLGGKLPRHDVILDVYHIDKTEVTNCQYEQCVTAGECEAPVHDYSATRSPYYPTYANYPVIFVTWYQANRYCQWADKRLPTEAEWEKAARSNHTRPYPWGAPVPTCAAEEF